MSPVRPERPVLSVRRARPARKVFPELKDRRGLVACRAPPETPDLPVKPDRRELKGRADRKDPKVPIQRCLGHKDRRDRKDHREKRFKLGSWPVIPQPRVPEAAGHLPWIRILFGAESDHGVISMTRTAIT